MKQRFNPPLVWLNLYLLLFSAVIHSHAMTPADVTFKGETLVIGEFVEILEDETGKMTFTEVTQSGEFAIADVETPNLGISKSTFWIRFAIRNESDTNRLMLELANPKIELCQLFKEQSAGIPFFTHSIDDPFYLRPYGVPNVALTLLIEPGTRQVYYLKIKGSTQMVVPLIVSSDKGFLNNVIKNHLFTGIHIGILLAMCLYNLFLYFSIRDKNYIYYILYIIFIGFTQTTITGYSRYLWPDSPDFDSLALIMFPALSGLFAILFFQHTIRTREKVPVYHFVLNTIIGVYVIAVLLRFINFHQLSYRLIDLGGLLAVMSGLIISAMLSYEKYRPARFFLLAWGIFFVGMLLYVARNFGVLPYNMFTNYTMYAGTAIEVLLLSFALADRINVLKKEKEQSQREALQASLDNQRIMKEQNVMLERMVKERTLALTDANEELTEAMAKLQNAQTNLIESEKMASLGQLTAGIAHEINNPINFVSSNIKPLKRDIDDLLEVLNLYDTIDPMDTSDTLTEKLGNIGKFKEQIDLEYTITEVSLLLTGIEEGASRTVGIVKELKNFSRLDESDIKPVNLNEGIESTLVILNHQLSNNIEVFKELGDLPEIECYAGKLNQVFMNILSNSIFALENYEVRTPPPSIWIRSWYDGKGYIYVSLKDNGIGIPPELKSKIFDPFFTTKDVGKGTGLGLSIVFKIIEAHAGNIEVISEPGFGTEFIIKLPIRHQTSPVYSETDLLT